MNLLIVGKELTDFFDLPWPSIFAFFGLVALLLFTFGPKVPIIAGFFAGGVQDFLGITGLRDDLHTEAQSRQAMHAANITRFEGLETKIDGHAADAQMHYKRTEQEERHL